ncbi:TetR/AcrR family transcriptional regulator [Clostridium saccharobutylicum]|uniref:Bacterial regulatory protein, tetR family n=1 Tax=Clostridium saccharobutylicum TaxID=169679 RepID=A0A1S8NEC5_CLOSA|nr:TetR/AcrR family transcriptional regulator [Clostridium saccharobutylicum]OOM14631.1 bacterial regulatory protein, tetR family [Clostridium saccharobutylicum]
MKEHIEKKDRRIGKTQKSIRDALMKLLEEKDASQITIKELAECANINRKTFYMHYSSIDAIFDKIEDETIEKFLLILDKCDFFHDQFNEYAFFTSLNDVINEDFDFYQKLIRANSYNFLLIKVKKILKDTLIERFYKKLNNDKEVLNLYAEFTASGIMSMYIEWFNIDSKLSLEDLAKTASNIAFKGINSILLS